MRCAVAAFDGKDGSVQGQVRFDQLSRDDPVRVDVDLRGLTPSSRHAIHIHEYGYFQPQQSVHDCCMAAGGHWNPYGAPHGSKRLDGDDAARRHAGDLCNNLDAADANGSVRMQFSDGLLSLYGDTNIYGRSVVIHVGVDDEGRGEPRATSLTTGNAGDRLACAAIVRCAPPHPSAPQPSPPQPSQLPMQHEAHMQQLFGP